MKVVLFSYHYLQSRTRAGFHHLAEAYWELGWDVIFVTAPVSWLSYLVRDARRPYPLREEARRLKHVRERLRSYVLFTPVHPANLRVDLLNQASGRLLLSVYRRTCLGSLVPELQHADLVVFESTPAIVLAPSVRRLAPKARLAYRVSDDLEVLRVHPAVVAAELEALPVFDLVSVVNTYSERRLGRAGNVVRQPPAIDKAAFDADCETPYSRGVNACWVGKWHLDPAFLEEAADRLPEWTFHIIGPAPRSVVRHNVVWYGELPFLETVPYIRHADVGLAAFGGRAGRVPGYLAESSLKVTQYAYCGLPVVMPSTMRSDRPHTYYYEPGDGQSVERALRDALAAGRRPELGLAIPSWRDLAVTLAGERTEETRLAPLRDAELG